MIEERFDAVAKRAAGTSRRRSLMTLGSAVLAAAVTRPAATEAARSGKRARKKARKQARKMCRRQVGQCHDFLTWACADQPCVESLQHCCSSFAGCDASTALRCIFEPEQPDEA